MKRTITMCILCISAYAGAVETSSPWRNPVVTKPSEESNIVNMDYRTRFMHVTKKTDYSAQLNLLNTSIPLQVIRPGVMVRKIPGMSTPIGRATIGKTEFGTIDVSNAKLIEGLFTVLETLITTLENSYNMFVGNLSEREKKVRKLLDTIENHLTPLNKLHHKIKKRLKRLEKRSQ